MRKDELAKIPLEERAEKALKKAVAETIADHKRSGDPIAVWRNGKVVWIEADQIVIRETEAEYDSSGKAELK